MAKTKLIVKNKKLKTLPKSKVATLIGGGLLVLGVVGSSLYYIVNQPRTKDVGYAPIGAAIIPNSPKITPSPTEASCTEDLKVCSDGSLAKRISPSCEFAECGTPAESGVWQRVKYMSGGKVVWDILQPEKTSSMQKHLSSDYLSFSTEYNGKKFMAEFAKYSFDKDNSEDLDENVSLFLKKQSFPFLSSEIVAINHPQKIPIRMIKTISEGVGGTKEKVAMRMNFVLIGKYSDQNGEVKGPMLILIKPYNEPNLDRTIVDEFSLQLIQGIRF